MDLDERASRCRVLWEKARNMYGSFFAELADVRSTMSPAEFDAWCFKSVGVSLSVAIKASEVLKATDAARVQSELKAVVRTAKEAGKQDILDIKAKQIATRLAIEKNRTAIRDQEAINSRLKYEPVSTLVANILTELAAQRVRTRIQNGLAYILLKEAVKSGAEGIDPSTGKKWKWEKWAVLAIGRPIASIRGCMWEAKKFNHQENVQLQTFSGKVLNGSHNPSVVDDVYHA